MNSRIDEREAVELAAERLREKGAPLHHALLQATVMVDAELKGHPSHGLQRLPRLLLRIERGLADPAAVGRFDWRGEAFLHGEGQNGLGPVVAINAIDRIGERASKTGVALAAIRNANHLGMLAYYVEQAAAEGFIAIALSSSEALVHPHGGTEAMLGTNPIAIAVPVGNDRPLVVDLATSKISMGKVHHFAGTGRPLEPGWARDAAGNPTTDAASARDGSLAPFGGAKGYALGLAFELIVASLADSALAPFVGGTLDADRVCNKGDVFVLMDARRSAGLSERLANYLENIRQSVPDGSGETVTVPGDGSRRRKAETRERGIEIASELYATLTGTPLQEPSHIRGRLS